VTKSQMLSVDRHPDNAVTMTPLCLRTAGTRLQAGRDHDPHTFTHRDTSGAGQLTTNKIAPGSVT
jgi:hypothetical protein